MSLCLTASLLFSKNKNPINLVLLGAIHDNSLFIAFPVCDGWFADTHGEVSDSAYACPHHESSPGIHLHLQSPHYKQTVFLCPKPYIMFGTKRFLSRYADLLFGSAAALAFGYGLLMLRHYYTSKEIVASMLELWEITYRNAFFLPGILLTYLFFDGSRFYLGAYLSYSP